jgi:hypothetical protein
VTNDGGTAVALQPPPGLEPDLEGEHMLISSPRTTTAFSDWCRLDRRDRRPRIRIGYPLRVRRSASTGGTTETQSAG